LNARSAAAGLTLLFESSGAPIWLPIGVAGVFFPPVRLRGLAACCASRPLRLALGIGRAFVFPFLAAAVLAGPAREAALSRLEKSLRAEHRPLTAFNDTLLQKNPTPETLALWEAHPRARREDAQAAESRGPPANAEKYDFGVPGGAPVSGPLSVFAGREWASKAPVFREWGSSAAACR